MERLADNRFSIDEAGVAQISSNFNQFMTQVRLIPYFEGNKSARYLRHHLLRWCYDTHTKVPSFEYGTFKVKWLPPPTKPPTG